MVESSIRLKVFKLDVTVDYLSEDIHPVHALGSARLPEVLASQKECLESLHLSYDALTEAKVVTALNFQQGFSDFLALRHLSCPLAMIREGSGASATILDSLPKSLLAFHPLIRRFTDDRHYIDALEHLALNLPTSSLQLKEIQICAPAYAPWLKHDWAHLIKCFSATTVSFNLQRKPYFVEEEDDDDEGFRTSFDTESTDSSESSGEVDLYSTGSDDW